MNKVEKGFSLIELITVISIILMISQLGFAAFTRYVRRTKAFAAKTALKNIKRECESNRSLGLLETFALIPIKGYSISTRDTNSCLGQSSDGKVALIADNQEEIPNYFYDFLNGEISCLFLNSSSGIFKSCSKGSLISNWEEYAIETSKTKKVIPMLKDYSCNHPNPTRSHHGKMDYAIDNNPRTRAFCFGKFDITFKFNRFNRPTEIRSINVFLQGRFTSGNYIKLYVDDKLVAEGSQNAFAKTWLIEPTMGKTFRYESTSEPHLVSKDGSTATIEWSEIGEISINGVVSECTNKNNCWNNINDK